ncbi:ankyrin repeat-containing domain protein, partial [Coprinopsis sp. MPI-PUGE-AT-0042]
LGAVRNLRKIHLDIVSKITPGTGVWLLKNDRFIIWLDLNGDLKILWGTGIPGAGKTVLASIVIRHLEAHAAAAGGGICVCYVYIRYSDRADLTIRNILEILVKQTVERHAECKPLAEQAYAQHIREGTQPTEAELLQLLHQFTEATEATFYVLDALDEAPDWIQVDLVQKLASLNVRLFITSRPLKGVEARAPEAHGFPIVAQDGDLDLHIAREIARSRDLQDLLENTDLSLRDEIVSLVKSKCGGMFLHASLQLEALSQCSSIREVRQTLAAFPVSIEGVYRQTWLRILEQLPGHVSLAKAVLVWVLNASRPMTIEEVERAVATSPDTFQFEQDRLVRGTTLIAYCRGLVTLEVESRLVRLVHYTAKDTLQELLHDSFPKPHSHLAMVCMTHLKECGFQNATLRSEEAFTAALRADPLLAYASDAWATHAGKSLDVEDVKSRTTEFVTECHAFPTFTCVSRCHNFDIIGPIHILAMHNLFISLPLDEDIGDPNVATQIERLSPLMLASCHGHAGFVASLLAHPKVQVNHSDNDGCSAIMCAAAYGHNGIITALLAHPEIQVNLVSSKGWSAFFLAVGGGHEGIVKLLLARTEIQVNLVDNKGCSALMKAAANGHEGTVKLLLACHEIQVNLVDNEGGSALMKAAANGHAGVVRLLLAHPEVQVNSVDNDGRSVLMMAARYGHEGILKLLLACHGIQVNQVNKEGSSALMLAAECGHEGIVTLLIACTEIQVNLVSNSEEMSALMLAATNGHEAIVNLLLAHPGVHVNLVGSRGWSALAMAAFHGYEGVVSLLLEHPEIQVNLVESQGVSALM